MDKVTAINTIADFLGVRDLESLTQDSLQKQYGIKQTDVMVLFGGSIITGGDAFAQALENHLASHTVIVGGCGHTTPVLIEKMSQALPNLDLEGLSEAELFQKYLQNKYHLEAELLETKSTNCGNNITYLLDLLETKGIDWQSMLLMQDASMMRRMSATLKKFAPEKTIIDYATYKVRVTEIQDKLEFEKELPYMWTMKHYISLLLGEIPRLRDDESGYGPLGKDFIAHVDIPTEVMAAFDYLQEEYPELVRSANPKFASK